MTEQTPLVVVVMGVAGSGKTTVARALSLELSATFLDADDFHSPENVAKMASGEPLSDRDREGWLLLLRARIDEVLENKVRAVLACSALKQSYRDKLGIGRPEVELVYLRGDERLFRERLEGRTGHFMKASLLESQLSALEEPRDGIAVDAAKIPAEIVGEVTRALRERGR